MMAETNCSLTKSCVRADDEGTAEEEESTTRSDDGDGRPTPCYDVLEKVYARDKDGLMYEATVRRRLYGPDYNRQVQVAMVGSMDEVKSLVEQQEREVASSWHYFVHFTNWRVNWDRWVAEEDMYDINKAVKAYACHLTKEHRSLQATLQRNRRGKKYQKIDGAQFLQAWGKRLVEINKEFRVEDLHRNCTNSSSNNNNEGPKASDQIPKNRSKKVGNKREGNNKAFGNKKPETGIWSKELLTKELSLRAKSLTRKRNQFVANKIVLPKVLKKILVDQWELITQCQMVACLPAPITVRQALDMYLKSKNIYISLVADGGAADVNDTATSKYVKMNPEDYSDEFPAETAEKEVTSSSTLGGRDQSLKTTDSKQHEADGPPADSQMETLENDDDERRVGNIEDDLTRQEWIDMVRGVAMLFDEAVPDRVLYREELPQYRVLDFPEGDCPCDVYGCEHLLRLFVRLPELLADELDEADARPIVGKVNDLVRFLNKNQATCFAQRCRKPNDLEVKEMKRINKREENEKRKRAAVEKDDVDARDGDHPVPPKRGRC